MKLIHAVMLIATVAVLAFVWKSSLTPRLSVIHPLCLEAIWGDDESLSITCADNLSKRVFEKSVNDGVVIASYSEDADEENDYISIIYEDHLYPMSKELGEGDELHLIVTTTNYGGSGHLSRLMGVGKRNNDLFPIFGFYSGDRCNDGSIKIINFDPVSFNIHWSSAATPFRLLNPTDNTDWRMVHLINRLKAIDDEKRAESPPGIGSVPAQVTNKGLRTAFDWYPYTDVQNHATGCSGRIHHSYHILEKRDEVIAVEIDTKAWRRQSQGRYAKCLSEWISYTQIYQSSKETIIAPLDEWVNLISSAGNFCLGR